MSKGGECLSTDYVGHGTILDWRCERGHRFKLAGLAVKTGVWCPKCPPLSAVRGSV